jgi:hypothetical protein
MQRARRRLSSEPKVAQTERIFGGAGLRDRSKGAKTTWFIRMRHYRQDLSKATPDLVMKSSLEHRMKDVRRLRAGAATRKTP